MPIKDTLINTTSETIDIINKVDSFYNSAWEKLLMFGVIGGTIVGVIVPLVIQYYQRALSNQNEKLLEEKIKNEILKMKEELDLEFQGKIEKYLKEADIKIKKAESLSMALTFHMQGNIDNTRNLYKQAFENYMKACFYYLACGKYASIRNCLKSMSGCLNHLTLKDIQDNSAQKYNINKLITDIEKNDKVGFTSNELTEIKRLIAKFSR